MHDSKQEKNLEWFTVNYPDTKERILHISDHLHYHVDGKVSISDEIKNELLEAINQYWADTIGLDIKEYLSED